MPARTWIHLVVVAPLVLGTAACSSDDETSAPAAESSPSAPAGGGETTVGADPLPTAVPQTAEPVALGSRVLKKFDISTGPDWLVAAAGSVWVKADSGTVTRIDPAHDSVLATITVASPEIDNLCQGIGGTDEAIWTCAPEGRVVRIDPATNEVVATVDAAKSTDQGTIPVADGRAWILSGDGSRLVGIAGDAVDRTVELGTRCTDLGGSSGAVWAVCPIDDQVLRIDPVAGRVELRVTGLDNPRSVAVADSVWVNFAGGIAKMDAATGAVEAVADAQPGTGGAIHATSDEVWVREQGRFLRRIDAGTAQVIEEFTAPEQSAGSLLVAFGSLWTTAYDDDVLYRLRPE